MFEPMLITSTYFIYIYLYTHKYTDKQKIHELVLMPFYKFFLIMQLIIHHV